MPKKRPVPLEDPLAFRDLLRRLCAAHVDARRQKAKRKEYWRDPRGYQPLPNAGLLKERAVLEDLLQREIHSHGREWVVNLLADAEIAVEDPPQAVALQYLSQQLAEAGDLADRPSPTRETGEPRSADEVQRIVQAVLYRATAFEKQCRIIVPDLSVANRECIEFLSKHPKYLHDLQWRVFEEMLAAVFRSLGYDTELGPGTGDGGVDLRLLQKASVGTFLILVQAKRYREDRPVRLEAVQALYSIVETEGASKGILATTSRFLPGAQSWAKARGHRLLLAGPEEIAAWLETAAKRT